jgi:hypothetical protein
MQEITGKESRRIAMNRRTSHQISEIGMGNFSLDHDAFFSSFHHHFKIFQVIAEIATSSTHLNPFFSVFNPPTGQFWTMISCWISTGS